MCGIAGIVDLRGGQVVPPGSVRGMADAIVHRGPDDEGYFERDGLADYETSLEGMTLSRFDRVLGLPRERMAKIYVVRGVWGAMSGPPIS